MHNPSVNRNIPVLLALGGALVIMLVAAAGYSVATLTGMGLIPGGQGAAPDFAAPTAAPLPIQITESEAHELVWSVPEVQSMAENVRANGSRPITFTLTKPEASALPGTLEAAYVIRLAEDRGDHIAAVETFAVDAFTREVTVFDPIEWRLISLEEWRRSR